MVQFVPRGFGAANLPIISSWTMNQDFRLAVRRKSSPKGGSLPDVNDAGIANAAILSGKEMSFNNYVDADAAWQLVCDFEQTACAIIKHTNPAGVGLAETPAEAYRKALATDPVSAFGGIVAFNRAVDVLPLKR